MKIFKTDAFNKKENPTPGELYRKEILTNEHSAINLGGIFGLFPSGSQGAYHYHRERESLVVVISGEAVEVVEGKDNPIKAGDVIYIPAGEKHKIVNNSDMDFRFLEFYTCPPLSADKVELE